MPSSLPAGMLLELIVVLLPGEREIGTEGKILLLAREDKKLQGVGLQSRQPVRSPRSGRALQNIPFSGGDGLHRAVVRAWCCFRLLRVL